MYLSLILEVIILGPQEKIDTSLPFQTSTVHMINLNPSQSLRKEGETFLPMVLTPEAPAGLGKYNKS